MFLTANDVYTGHRKVGYRGGMFRVRRPLADAYTAAASVAALFAATGCGAHLNNADGRTAHAPGSGMSASDARPQRHSAFETLVLHFGHRARPAQWNAVAGLVRHYYAAAAAEDGSTACTLIDRPVATSVPQDYAQAAGYEPSTPGLTCARVMSGLFARSHAKLTAESSSMRIPQIRLKTKGGYALLSFATTSEPREMTIVRERGEWKVSSLFDTGLD
jgi:hypothetical protein